MTERIDGRSLRYQHRREELLVAVGDYVLDHGIATLSLRRVAKEVGISHATLQHHFGTREELVDEIVEHLLERTLIPAGSTAPVIGDGEQRLRAMWAGWTSPQGRRDIRLFIEIVGQSLFDEPGYVVTVQHSMERRMTMLAASFVDQSCPPDEAPAVATLLIAGLRGLMYDLLVTGDIDRVQAAFEIVIEHACDRMERWAPGSTSRNGAHPVASG